MTKKERELIGKQISSLSKKYKEEWQELKEQISDYGYQDFYPAQDYFIRPIKRIISSLSDEDKLSLVAEWKSRPERMQFDNDKTYLVQYEAYIMEELVSRARKATYWM